MHARVSRGFEVMLHTGAAGARLIASPQAYAAPTYGHLSRIRGDGRQLGKARGPPFTTDSHQNHFINFCPRHHGLLPVEACNWSSTQMLRGDVHQNDDVATGDKLCTVHRELLCR